MERIGKRVRIPCDPVAVIGESAATMPLADAGKAAAGADP